MDTHYMPVRKLLSDLKAAIFFKLTTRKWRLNIQCLGISYSKILTKISDYQSAFMRHTPSYSHMRSFQACEFYRIIVTNKLLCM